MCELNILFRTNLLHIHIILSELLLFTNVFSIPHHYTSNIALDKRGILFFHSNTLQKHAYSNILKILLPKNENFQIKILIFFYISDQNIDCG